MPFLSGAPLPKKNPGSAPASVACLLIHDFEHFSEQSGFQKRIIIPGSLYDSGKLPTYPSPKPIFFPK